MNFMLLGLALLAVAGCSAHQFARCGKAVAGGKPAVVFRNSRAGQSLARQTWASVSGGLGAVACLFFALTHNRRKALTAVACTLAAVSQFSGCATGGEARAEAATVAAKAWDFYTENYASSLGVEAGPDGQPRAYLKISREPKQKLSEADIQALMAHFLAYKQQADKAVIPQEVAP